MKIVFRKTPAHRVGLLLALTILAACDSLAPEPPTLTPTWEFTGPTIVPSPTVLNLMPTLPPPDASGPGQNNPLAAALPAHGDMPPLFLNGNDPQMQHTVQLPLRSGVILIGVLYENPPVQLEQGPVQSRLPGILLLGVLPEAWGSFPMELRDAGYTVLVVDMDVEQTAEAFVDVMNAFSHLQSVNPGLMAAVGAGSGAYQGMTGCAVQLLCDALVMVTPQVDDILMRAQVDYNPRPLMIAVAEGDIAAQDAASALERAAQGEVVIETVPGNAQGGDLLVNNAELRGAVIDWLKRTLIE